MLAASLFARPVEALLNRQVEASTPARAALASLEGRSFALEIEGGAGHTLLRLTLRAEGGRLAIHTGETVADALVRGTPVALGALFAGRAAGRTGSGGVTIEGDAEIAAAFEKLLGHAEWDLEAELARLVGDGPANLAARGAREMMDFGRRAARTLLRTMGEYLTEESRDVVSRAELDAFHADVDVVREDVDRAEARLSLLESRSAHKAR